MRRFPCTLAAAAAAVLAACVGAADPSQELAELADSERYVRAQLDLAQELRFDPPRASAALDRAEGRVALAQTLAEGRAEGGHATVELDDAFARLERLDHEVKAAKAGMPHVVAGTGEFTPTSLSSGAVLTIATHDEPACDHAPKPSVSLVYATPTVLKLRVQSDCDVVDEWHLLREIPAVAGSLFNFEAVGSGTGSRGTVRDMGLGHDTQHCYWAYATNEHGTLWSNRFCARTDLRAGTPAAPLNFAAGRNDVPTMLLVWQDAADNEYGYVVTRALASSYGHPIDEASRDYEYAGYIDSYVRSSTGENMGYEDRDEGLEEDSLYCYYLYAQNPWGESDAAHACGWSGLTQPGPVSFDNFHVDADRIRFRARSSSADVFQVFVYREGDYLHSEEFEATGGAYAYIDFDDLEPETEYCFRARPFNEPRSIAHDVTPERGPISEVCRTTGTPGPITGRSTIRLERQRIVSGPIPYLGRWAPLGSRNLVELSIPSELNDLFVHFVKPGHDTTECGDPSAVVTLQDGESASAAQITALFGSAQPSAPLDFIACVSGPASTPLRDWINVNVAYESD